LACKKVARVPLSTGTAAEKDVQQLYWISTAVSVGWMQALQRSSAAEDLTFSIT